MTDHDGPGPTEHQQLIPVIIREFAKTTGGHQLSPEDAAALGHRLLAGRTVSSPYGYVVKAIRDAPDPFALIEDDAPPRPSGGHPSARPVSEVLGDFYQRRRAQVVAYYAEDERRKAAGEPAQWQEREARLHPKPETHAPEHRCPDCGATYDGDPAEHAKLHLNYHAPLPAADEIPMGGSTEPPF